MLNKDNVRELAFLTYVDAIEPIEGKDRVEAAVIGGWKTMVKKGAFNPGDIGIYFEVDSKLPEKPEYEFTAKYHYKIKTQKFKQFYSQGLLMHPNDIGWEVVNVGGNQCVKDDKGEIHFVDAETRFLTKQLGVTYAVAEDNKRKAKQNPDAKINAALARHPKIAKKYGKFIKKHKVIRKLFIVFFGKKKDSETNFPTHFPYVNKTDQERCENMKYVLEDKTPFIKTQKCDGSSGTYILERKGKNKFEFYVCSRNVRQLDEKQQCYYDENFYWQAAKKYNIEEFLKKFLLENPNISYVCLQGEICAPKIQGNPHGLSELHFYAFHFTDSEQGRWDIREAKKLWDNNGIESVPIVDENYILPDDFEAFKLEADGFYDPSVCEGKKKQEREGFVYYKTTDPNFSFKNVSRKYLLKHE